MNIYQKLIEVRKSCEYLKKENKGYQFQFVSSSQTLAALRDSMDAHGLLLVPSVLDSTVTHGQTQKGGHRVFTQLKMQFTWINAEKPEERLECLWEGHGVDDAEKGVGKALTYAEKFFLLKFFNIATDKDDPDAHQAKHTNGKTQAQQLKEELDGKEVDPLADAKKPILKRLDERKGDLSTADYQRLHGLVRAAKNKAELDGLVARIKEALQKQKQAA